MRGCLSNGAEGVPPLPSTAEEIFVLLKTEREGVGAGCRLGAVEGTFHFWGPGQRLRAWIGRA